MLLEFVIYAISRAFSSVIVLAMKNEYLGDFLMLLFQLTALISASRNTKEQLKKES